MGNAERKAKRLQAVKTPAEMWEVTVPEPPEIKLRTGQSRIDAQGEMIEVTKPLTYKRFFIDNIMIDPKIWGDKHDDTMRNLKLVAKLDQDFEGGERILLTDEEFRKANQAAKQGPWNPFFAMQTFHFVESLMEYDEEKHPGGARRVPVEPVEPVE